MSDEDVLEFKQLHLNVTSMLIKMSKIWDEHQDEIGRLVTNYPEYMPSFDEFYHDFNHMLDKHFRPGEEVLIPNGTYEISSFDGNEYVNHSSEDNAGWSHSGMEVQLLGAKGVFLFEVWEGGYICNVYVPAKDVIIIIQEDLLADKNP